MYGSPTSPVRRIPWSAMVATCLVLVIVLAVIGANSMKSEFRVARIRTQGNRIVTENEIRDLAAIPKNGKLIDIDLNAIRTRVQRNQFVKSASVSREWPDGIMIEVVERVPIAAIVTDRVMYIDASGYMLPPEHSEYIFDLPVITGDIPEVECYPGRQVTASQVQEALYLLSTAHRIGEDLYQLISEVHVDKENGLMLFTTEYGVPVRWGNGNAAVKLVTFDGFWKQIVMQRGAAGLKLVDLRFADQVVVRWSEAEPTEAR